MRAPATLAELEIWVVDVLRLDKPLYARVSSVSVAAAPQNVCGWSAEIKGDFEAANLVVIDGAITGLQRSFYLLQSVGELAQAGR